MHLINRLCWDCGDGHWGIFFSFLFMQEQDVLIRLQVAAQFSGKSISFTFPVRFGKRQKAEENQRSTSPILAFSLEEE
jgi:hypothetical protein